MSTTVDIKLTLYTVAALAALAVAFALPTQAWAGSDCAAAGSDPTAAQYCTEEPPPPEEPPVVVEPSPESEVATEVIETAPAEEGSSEVAGVSGESGSLPFTGADLLALAAVACAFICIGLALQRLSTAKPGSR